MCKPFSHGDMVLVKNNIDEYWVPAIFHSYSMDQSLGQFNILGVDGNLGDYFNICIPYNGNEHLAGKKDYPFKYGEMVLMRNEDDEIWLPRIYHSAVLKKTGEIKFIAMGHKENPSTEYKECAIFDEKFIRTSIAKDPITFKIGYTSEDIKSTKEEIEPSIIEVSNVKSIYNEHPDFTIEEISKNLNYPKSMVEKCLTKIKDIISNESNKENDNEL